MGAVVSQSCFIFCRSHHDSQPTYDEITTPDFGGGFEGLLEHVEPDLQAY